MGPFQPAHTSQNQIPGQNRGPNPKQPRPFRAPVPPNQRGIHGANQNTRRHHRLDAIVILRRGKDDEAEPQRYVARSLGGDEGGGRGEVGRVR
ncbi:hypothetical protein BP6252_09984 [Coleophoma cylindrospora]|uniref:Uncharacterized protein n=1 Tax=Coleophoma cylindrospora TaxID=1849047 RepID=A0A3D8QX56_9HELO|nr:hypothetical protein BP6252_09984 [Coleophoma cylindrospora]